jgi:type I restriction enzyme, S subunit
MKKGWEIKRLEDVCEKASSNIAVNKIENENGDYPIYGASGFIKNVSFYHQEKPYIGIIKDGAGVGRISLLEAYSSIIGTLQYLIPNPDIDIKYFYYFLLGIDFSKHINGSTIPHIYFKDYKEEPFLYVPISEQQKIVSILNKAFAAIEQAKENLQRNLQNAKELFQSELNNNFTNNGVGWEEKKLGDVCNVIGGGTPSKANDKFYGGDIYWATVRDMKSEIIRDTEHRITKEAVKKSSTNIIPKGNVIIATRVGLGKVCLIENDTAINQDLRGVVPINSNALNVDFLFRWFKCIAHKIVAEGTGATVQGVKLPFIKSLPIFLPSIKEQKKIVSQLDKLSTETKALENIYQKKLDNLEELKKSILKKAFSGELIIK